MRRNPITEFSCFLLAILVLLNLFSGSAWCLLLMHDQEEGVYSFNEPGDQTGELECIKVTVGFSEASSADFHRMNEHEISYNGRLYDVVKSFTKSGFQYYYCRNDVREEKILNQVRQCTEAHLDFFNSVNHARAGSVKIFVQESIVEQNTTGEISERNFPGAVRNEDFYSCFFFRKIDPPPESLIS